MQTIIFGLALTYEAIQNERRCYSIICHFSLLLALQLDPEDGTQQGLFPVWDSFSFCHYLRRAAIQSRLV
jgi:hypothetical protein